MIEIIRAGVFDSSRFFKEYEKTPERTTKFYEIELYVSGEGETCIDSVKYPHKKGNLVFARPGRQRFSKNKFICFNIHLNMDKKTEHLLKSAAPVTEVGNYAAYENIFLEIIRLFESNSEDTALLMQSKIYKLFDMISKDSRINRRMKNTGGKLSGEVIKKAMEYIDENLHKRLTLEDIAKSVNFSPIYFHKAFCLYAGKTPHAYLSEKRLEAAKMYLLTTDYPMEQIVDKCGFSSHSYFDYHFKKAYGITPSEFRKRKYIL